MNRKDFLNPNSESIPFDPTGTDLTEEQVGPAIRELAATVGVSASPGFQFGRAGNLNDGTYLYTVGGVPSNRAGITVALDNPVITAVYVANQNISTFDIQIFQHDGNEAGITFVGTVSIVNARSGTFAVNFPLIKGRQLATRVNFGSARNCNVGLQLQGNT